MQYLLTEEEYNNLIPKSDLTPHEIVKIVLMDKILELTNNNPCGIGYCDNCPLVKLAHEKGISYRFLCRAPNRQNFSQ